MTAIGEKNLEVLRERIDNGELFSVAWDNAQLASKKAEEILINRKKFVQNTTAFTWFLHAPRPENAKDSEGYNALVDVNEESWREVESWEFGEIRRRELRIDADRAQ